ncbi:MAG: RnfABCDGE type electron transport complex subunit G [Fusicatenibacter sp.]|nr:RnfABCDGE type electron transport complex subunit G [Fusicatenibacter sp.]
MKKIIKNALILTAITLVAGLLLGAVHAVTLKPIQEQQEKSKQKAFEEVFSEAASFETVDITAESDAIREHMSGAGFTAQTIDEVWLPLDESGNVMGLVIVLSTTEGYDGGMQFSIGVTEDGTMTGISFLSLSETAGLGMKANTDEFKSQFKGKAVEAFEYTKTGAVSEDQIDALSGATLTTGAVTNGVNAGLEFFRYCSETGLVEKGGSAS